MICRFKSRRFCDLKNTADISDMVHEANEPIYITKNGYGDMIIMSMKCMKIL